MSTKETKLAQKEIKNADKQFAAAEKAYAKGNVKTAEKHEIKGQAYASNAELHAQNAENMANAQSRVHQERANLTMDNLVNGTTGIPGTSGTGFTSGIGSNTTGLQAGGPIELIPVGTTGLATGPGFASGATGLNSGMTGTDLNSGYGTGLNSGYGAGIGGTGMGLGAGLGTGAGVGATGHHLTGLRPAAPGTVEPGVTHIAADGTHVATRVVGVIPIPVAGTTPVLTQQVPLQTGTTTSYTSQQPTYITTGSTTLNPAQSAQYLAEHQYSQSGSLQNNQGLNQGMNQGQQPFINEQSTTYSKTYVAPNNSQQSF